MQVLPPTVNNGVNADSGYDAEGISLIDDRDESQSLKNSDDEDNEEARQAHLFSLFYFSFRLYPAIVALLLTRLCSDSRGVRFADEAVVLQEDSAQHSYAPPPPPSTPTAVQAPYPEPMHPSAPSFPVTFDTQLLQLTVCFSSCCSHLDLLTRHATQIPCSSLPLKLHPLPNSAKGSLVSIDYSSFEALCFLRFNRLPCQVQLSQATELISQSLVPRGRADLSTVIAFVNKNIYPSAQDPSAKAKDFAWFALRPVSGAHVRAVCNCCIVP